MQEENEQPVYEEAVDFLLAYVARVGHNPEHRQAQGLMVRIEEIKQEARRDYEQHTRRGKPNEA